MTIDGVVGVLVVLLVEDVYCFINMYFVNIKCYNGWVGAEAAGTRKRFVRNAVEEVKS